MNSHLWWNAIEVEKHLGLSKIIFFDYHLTIFIDNLRVELL